MLQRNPSNASVDDADAVSSRRERIIKALVFVGVITIWEIGGRSINPLLIAVPSQIAQAFWELLTSGELARAFGQSMQSFAVGYAIAAFVGISIGLWMGSSRTVEVVLDPYISALYSTPLVALIPLLMLWFGIGFSAKVVIVSLFSVFPVIINTLTGVRNVEKLYLDVGTAFVLSRRQIFSRIILPSAVPYIMSGLRLAVSRGVIAMVVAEFLTAISGLGGMLINYSNSFDTPKLFVPLIVLALLGHALTFIVRHFEGRLTMWKR